MTEKQTVYLVYRNLDTTEGRGPMVLAKCFSSCELAKSFLSDKFGIMGTPLGEGREYSNGIIEYNGAWEIRPTEVLDSVLSKEEIQDLELKKLELEKELSKINRLLT